MAHSNRLISDSYVASNDLSTCQFRIVELIGAGKVNLAAANGGFGVLQNKPKLNEHATVAKEGMTKVHAGVAISAGDYIVSAASGYAVPIAVSSFQVASGAVVARRTIVGRAETAAASGSVFTMQLGVTPGVVVNSI